MLCSSIVEEGSFWHNSTSVLFKNAIFWCWHQDNHPRTTQEMTARAELIQGLMLRYCIQNIVRIEMNCKIFSNENFILVCLRRSNKCKIISILQIKWSDILWRYFNTHFLWDIVMGGFQTLNATCFWRDC